MIQLTDITNTLATHEQTVTEFLTLVENLVKQLRADIAALKDSIGKGDPAIQAAIDKLQSRIDASTLLILETRKRVTG